MAIHITNNTTPIHARVPPALEQAARQLAVREGESFSSVIRRLLRRGLEAERRSDPREAA